MSNINFDRFKNLTFDSFRQLAKDNSLSRHEKVGFPDSYREGKGDVIFADILSKLTNLKREKQTVVDIGAGCSDVPMLTLELCRQQGHTYIPIDSGEMLDLLPNEPFIHKVPAYFPNEAEAFIAQNAGKADVVLIYGVVQVVFLEGNLFKFFDKALSLLADGGQLLIGDINNVSKRKRFFSSANGTRFHQEFMQTDEAPQVNYSVIDHDLMDDGIILGMVMRARNAGFDAYLVPQAPDLPMANRREDILVYKP